MWRRQGRGAGHKRNRRMVDSGAHLCLAFIRQNSAGATGCAKLAQLHNIRTIIYRED
jgi:hypothetical protein